jgi:hypothetical protein
MLVRPDAVRPVRVDYDPEATYKNYSPTRVFKTVDPTIKVGDMVIVQTRTRHGFTVCKVTEVDFPVDYNSGEQWDWIAQKFDVDAFNKILDIEKGVTQQVAKASENKMRQEIIDAMGLGNVDFSTLQLQSLRASNPDGSTPARSSADFASSPPDPTDVPSPVRPASGPVEA